MGTVINHINELKFDELRPGRNLKSTDPSIAGAYVAATHTTFIDGVDVECVVINIRYHSGHITTLHSRVGGVPEGFEFHVEVETKKPFATEEGLKSLVSLVEESKSGRVDYEIIDGEIKLFIDDEPI